MVYAPSFPAFLLATAFGATRTLAAAVKTPTSAPATASSQPSMTNSASTYVSLVPAPSTATAVFSSGGDLLSTNLTNGIPIISPNNTSSTNSSINCTDITTGLAPACYLTNNMTTYFNNWNTSVGQGTCSPKQLWSDCYINSALSDTFHTNATAASLASHTCVFIDPPKSNNSFPAKYYYGLARLNNSLPSLNDTSANGTAPSTCPLPQANAKVWSVQPYYGVSILHNFNSHFTRWIWTIESAAAIPAIDKVLKESPGNTTNTVTRVLQTIINKYGLDYAADTAILRALELPYNISEINNDDPAWPNQFVTTTENASVNGKSSTVNATVVALPFGAPPATSSAPPAIVSSASAPASSALAAAYKNEATPVAEPAISLNSGWWAQQLVTRLTIAQYQIMSDFPTFLTIAQDGAFANLTFSSAAARIQNMINMDDGADGSQYGSTSGNNKVRRRF